MLLERNPIGECMDYALDVAGRAGLLGYYRMRAKYGRTDWQRNALAQRFMAVSSNPEDTLVMLDNDHAHPADVIERLVEVNKPVVGALAFKRGKPYEPCAFMYGEDGFWHSPVTWDAGVVYEVDGLGHAAIAIQRQAFLQLEAAGHKYPWWKYEYGENGDMPSEDMYFMRICREAGIKHHLHTGVVCPHHANGWVDKDSWDQYVADHPEIYKPAEELRVSVIVPARSSARVMRESLQGMIGTSRPDMLEVIVVATPESTAEAVTACDGLPVRVVTVPADGAGPAWNAGLSYCTNDWVFPAADDLTFHAGWFDACLKAAEAGFVAIHDNAGGAPLFMCRKDFVVDHLGGCLAAPHYEDGGASLEAVERARRVGAYALANEAEVQRLRVPGRSYGVSERDTATFEARKAAGFPDDFAPAITAATVMAGKVEGAT